MSIGEIFWKNTRLVSAPVFILLSGRAGVGKSTCAKYLCGEFKSRKFSSVVASFAKSVKDCAINSFDWDGRKDDKGRKLLQGIGNIGREYNENIWVGILVENEFEVDFTLIDDWRFPNERDYIANLGYAKVITIRVEASNRESLINTSVYNDISEISLPLDYSYDFFIDNSKDFKYTKEQLDMIIESILEEK
jgi:hypothetical protein